MAPKKKPAQMEKGRENSSQESTSEESESLLINPPLRPQRTAHAPEYIDLEQAGAAAERYNQDLNWEALMRALAIDTRNAPSDITHLFSDHPDSIDPVLARHTAQRYNEGQNDWNDVLLDLGIHLYDITYPSHAPRTQPLPDVGSVSPPRGRVHNPWIGFGSQPPANRSFPHLTPPSLENNRLDYDAPDSDDNDIDSDDILETNEVSDNLEDYRSSPSNSSSSSSSDTSASPRGQSIPKASSSPSSRSGAPPSESNSSMISRSLPPPHQPCCCPWHIRALRDASQADARNRRYERSKSRFQPDHLDGGSDRPEGNFDINDRATEVFDTDRRSHGRASTRGPTHRRSNKNSTYIPQNEGRDVSSVPAVKGYWKRDANENQRDTSRSQDIRTKDTELQQDQQQTSERAERRRGTQTPGSTIDLGETELIRKAKSVEISNDQRGHYLPPEAYIPFLRNHIVEPQFELPQEPEPEPQAAPQRSLLGRVGDFLRFSPSRSRFSPLDSTPPGGDGIHIEKARNNPATSTKRGLNSRTNSPPSPLLVESPPRTPRSDDDVLLIVTDDSEYSHESSEGSGPIIENSPPDMGFGKNLPRRKYTKKPPQELNVPAPKFDRVNLRIDAKGKNLRRSPRLSRSPSESYSIRKGLDWKGIKRFTGTPNPLQGLKPISELGAPAAEPEDTQDEDRSRKRVRFDGQSNDGQRTHSQRGNAPRTNAQMTNGERTNAQETNAQINRIQRNNAMIRGGNTTAQILPPSIILPAHRRLYRNSQAYDLDEDAWRPYPYRTIRYSVQPWLRSYVPWDHQARNQPMLHLPIATMEGLPESVELSERFPPWRSPSSSSSSQHASERWGRTSSESTNEHPEQASSRPASEQTTTSGSFSPSDQDDSPSPRKRKQASPKGKQTGRNMGKTTTTTKTTETAGGKCEDPNAVHDSADTPAEFDRKLRDLRRREAAFKAYSEKRGGKGKDKDKGGKGSSRSSTSSSREQREGNEEEEGPTRRSPPQPRVTRGMAKKRSAPPEDDEGDDEEEEGPTRRSPPQPRVTRGMAKKRSAPPDDEGDDDEEEEQPPPKKQARGSGSGSGRGRGRGRGKGKGRGRGRGRGRK
ncbi:MAG: hypothetical protein Q9227_007244 [Pyrenula ochraceoflavens]